MRRFLGDEDENWAKKAIDNLMKKLLKHNKDALASLEFALQVRSYCAFREGIEEGHKIFDKFVSS